MRVAEADTGNMYTDWGDMFTATFPNASDTDEMQGSPGLPYGYIAIARGTMAVVITETGSAQAIEAFGYITGETAGFDYMQPDTKNNIYNDPTWLIMPKMADGTYLTSQQITVGSGQIAGTESNELLYGSDGNDTISGKGGIDWVFGDEGNDVLSGGAGDDFIYGGIGDDQLSGGTGNDHLKGGGGADTFIFTGQMGADAVEDFTPGVDTLEIDANLDGNGLYTAADILASATQVGTDVVFDLGNGNTITLEDILLSQISASDISPGG